MTHNKRKPVRRIRDFWVDGHYIAATSEQDALEEAAALYAYVPEKVREWTVKDQEELDDACHCGHPDCGAC